MTVLPPSARSRPAPFAWLRALHEPHQVLSWTAHEWNRVVPLARRLRLLSRLAAGLEGAGLLHEVPAAVRRHLVGELRLSAWRIQALTWGLHRLERSLGDAPYPRLLLKGAAYLAQGLPIAAGRLPSDLDILVPRAHFPAALARLEDDGWTAGEVSAHDLRYYREWSHEAPPMTHPLHRVELDLHHNILPPVARTAVDAQRLLARAQPSAWPGWQVLHPVDQVLHSAAHLFLDAELQDRLRDIADLDGLLRHFSQQPDFWQQLPARAQALGLQLPLALATHFTTRWMGTAVPAATQQAILDHGLSSLQRFGLVPALEAVLTPTEPDRKTARRQEAAATLLRVRYHLHRLPLRLLLPHLLHKMQQRRSARRG